MAHLIENVSKIWPHGCIPYKIDPAIAGNRNTLYTVNIAISSWNGSDTGVELIQWTNETDYVYFTNGQACQSPVGRQGGPQNITCDLTRGFSLGRIASVTHEIGHAVGMYHEQNREDRDDFLVFHPDNISPAAYADLFFPGNGDPAPHPLTRVILLRQFNKIPGFISTYYWQYTSIMHYRPTVGSDPANPRTILVSIEGRAIFPSSNLTIMDKVGVNARYPLPSTNLRPNTANTMQLYQRYQDTTIDNCVEIVFEPERSTQPKIFYGIQYIDINGASLLRISVNQKGINTSTKRTAIRMMSWLQTKLYCIQASWLDVQPSPTLQVGTWDTSPLAQTPNSDPPPLARNTQTQISFQPAFPETPTVVVVLTTLDGRNTAANHGVVVYPSAITPSSFLINIDDSRNTRGSDLYLVGVRWMAYTNQPDIQSGGWDSQQVRPQNAPVPRTTQNIRFPDQNMFRTKPSVFVAFNALDVVGGTSTRVHCLPENVTTKGFTVQATTWSDTTLNYAKVQWIAQARIPYSSIAKSKERDALGVRSGRWDILVPRTTDPTRPTRVRWGDLYISSNGLIELKKSRITTRYVIYGATFVSSPAPGQFGPRLFWNLNDPDNEFGFDITFDDRVDYRPYLGSLMQRGRDPVQVSGQLRT